MRETRRAAVPRTRVFGRLTREALLSYYSELALVIIPHLRGRAFVSILGSRPGVRGTYLKDVPAGAPEWLPRAYLPALSRNGAPVVAPVVDDPAALLWLVQRGVIELHATLHRVDAVAKPDSVLFDLDPTHGTRRGETARVAVLLRDALVGLGLESCVKSSGARACAAESRLRADGRSHGATGGRRLAPEPDGRLDRGSVHRTGAQRCAGLGPTSVAGGRGGPRALRHAGGCCARRGARRSVRGRAHRWAAIAGLSRRTPAQLRRTTT
jgi:hypothetical protein